MILQMWLLDTCDRGMLKIQDILTFTRARLIYWFTNIIGQYWPITDICHWHVAVYVSILIFQIAMQKKTLIQFADVLFVVKFIVKL